MAEKNILDIETLRKLLSHDPETGALTWLHRPTAMFKDGLKPASHTAAVWNTKCCGKPALTNDRGRGYRYGKIFDGLFYAHRVIWALHYGEWPSDMIDHINGVRDDNRISNLRSVTQKENTRNSAKSKNNTSGIAGVRQQKNDGKWRARIKVDFQTINLGTFVSVDDAVAARKAAEIKYGFHENHGRPAT